MSIFEDTNPRALKKLLDRSTDRSTRRFPTFSATSSGNRARRQELIVSIASNYPAGSILRIRNTKQLFACREFEGAPHSTDTSTTFLVLDGQQRLTSLYQAFYGVGEHRYYLDLRKLMDGAEFEEAIFHLRANHKRAKAL